MTRIPVAANYLLDEYGNAALIVGTDLEASDATTMRELAATLVARHQVTIEDLDLAYGGLALGLPTPGEDPWGPLERALTVTVSPSGAFSWRPGSHVTVGDLRRTAAAGLCRDPVEGITLILTGGWGGLGAGPEWGLLLDLFEYIDNQLIYLGALYGGVQFARDIIAGAGVLVRRAAKVLEQVSRRVHREIDPATLEYTLDRAVELTPQVLARGLEISEADAEALLRLRGLMDDRAAEQGAAVMSAAIRLAADTFRAALAVEAESADEVVEARRQVRRRVDEAATRILGPSSPRHEDGEAEWAPPG